MELAQNVQTSTEAQQTQQIVTEHTLFAEPIFNIGNFTVTNSLLNSWLMILFVIVISVSLRSKIKLIPGKLQNMFEMVIEMFLETFDSVTGSRAKTLKFFPLVFTFFIFILINNWLGILPWVGSVGKVISEHGENIFVPLDRKSVV